MHDPRSEFHQQWDLNTGQIVREFIAHGSQLVGIAVRPTISGYSGANISTAKTLSEAVHFRPTDSMQVPTQSTSESASGESGAVGNIANTLAADNTARTQPVTMPGQVTNNTQQAPDSDAKSEVSYDPLFDDEPDADGEPDGENNGQWQATHRLYDLSSQNGPSTLAMPSHSTSQPNRASTSSVVVPKNAPPLLDSTGYSTFSPDVLMTASIDGQIILWDKRVNTPRKGVGRLEMSEKTPPWCVSVCATVVADQ
jgi:transcriptional activator SPT8